MQLFDSLCVAQLFANYCFLCLTWASLTWNHCGRLLLHCQQFLPQLVPISKTQNDQNELHFLTQYWFLRGMKPAYLHVNNKYYEVFFARVERCCKDHSCPVLL